MSQSEKENYERLEEIRKRFKDDLAVRRVRFPVNKRTHRIRFENETEDAVEIVVEPVNTPEVKT